MQCYRELRLLTARPTPADEARAPHRLYGTRPAANPGTAASWRAEALAAIAEAHEAGRLPILCGGTFLYVTALTTGLAEIPDPGPQARAEARALLAEIGPEALHARLTALDPETAATLRPTDSQRLARAWEVRSGTGRGLLDWQRAPGLPPADATFAAILLRPPRATLRAAIERRLDAMLTHGLMGEVAALNALHLDPALPAMRAHGVPEFTAHLAGALSLGEARARTVTATVRYTRRQETWLRHHDLAPPQQTLTIETENAVLEQQMQTETWITGIFQSTQA
jgi:tRNA dimethylallyltransferase